MFFLCQGFQWLTIDGHLFWRTVDGQFLQWTIQRSLTIQDPLRVALDKHWRLLHSWDRVPRQETSAGSDLFVLRNGFRHFGHRENINFVQSLILLFTTNVVKWNFREKFRWLTRLQQESLRSGWQNSGLVFAPNNIGGSSQLTPPTRAQLNHRILQAITALLSLKKQTIVHSKCFPFCWFSWNWFPQTSRGANLIISLSDPRKSLWTWFHLTKRMSDKKNTSYS